MVEAVRWALRSPLSFSQYLYLEKSISKIIRVYSTVGTHISETKIFAE